MLYQYSENYILPLSQAVLAEGHPALLSRMPGETEEEKEAGFRASYGWFMTHPGKKLLAAGQETGKGGQTSGESGTENEKTEAYVRALNGFYLAHPALWKLDSEPAGFEWINCHSWEENVVAFLRKSGKTEEDLLVVINFRPTAYEKFNVGVPYYGTFREVFNSDAEEFGGSGMRNARPLIAKRFEVDERSEAITLKLAPYAVLIFSCTRRERPGRKTVDSMKETATGAAERAVEKVSGAAGGLMERAGSAVEKASESSDTVSAMLKTATEVKDSAVKKASAVRKTAAKRASAVKKTAVKRASAAKETAAKRASAVKETAVKKASAAGKAAVRKVEELRGKENK